MKIGDMVVFSSAIKKPVIGTVLEIPAFPHRNFYSILLSDGSTVKTSERYLSLVG